MQESDSHSDTSDTLTLPDISLLALAKPAPDTSPVIHLNTPMTIFTLICRTLHPIDDRGTLLSLQKVNKQCYAASTPIIWKRVHFRTEEHWLSALSALILPKHVWIVDEGPNLPTAEYVKHAFGKGSTLLKSFRDHWVYVEELVLDVYPKSLVLDMIRLGCNVLNALRDARRFLSPPIHSGSQEYRHLLFPNLKRLRLTPKAVDAFHDDPHLAELLENVQVLQSQYIIQVPRAFIPPVHICITSSDTDPTTVDAIAMLGSYLTAGRVRPLSIALHVKHEELPHIIGAIVGRVNRIYYRDSFV
jgi:hypothetical protein